jgi:hypothetical protein
MPPLLDKVREQAVHLVSGENWRGFLGRLREGVKNLGARLVHLTADWEEKLWDPLPRGIREKLPWLEGKLVRVLAALVFAVLVVLVVLALPGSSGAPAVDGPAARAGMFKEAPIPAEDLFLPEEPDFLPPVILERQRRESWTAEDAEPYWYNPLEQGEEAWRERVEQVIDELLERVP